MGTQRNEEIPDIAGPLRVIVHLQVSFWQNGDGVVKMIHRVQEELRT